MQAVPVALLGVEVAVRLVEKDPWQGTKEYDPLHLNTRLLHPLWRFHKLKLTKAARVLLPEPGPRCNQDDPGSVT